MSKIERGLSDNDIGLIEEYANRFYIDPNGNKIEHLRFPSQQYNSYNLPIFGRLFGSNYYDAPNYNVPLDRYSQSDKSKNKEKSYGYGFAFAISILATSALYFLTTIPRLYNLAKDHYFTRTIERISKKDPKNEYERKIIAKLDRLIKADQSPDRLRSQKIKTATALGLIGSSTTYIASYSYNIIEDTLSYTNSVAPDFLVNFVKNKIPESLKPSEQTKDKIIEFLSNDNLVNYAKYTAIASVGLLAINGIYNIYKDFFYDTTNSKMDLSYKAGEIKSAINEMRHGSFSSILPFQFQAI